jgi:hypothetical protein
MGNMQMNQEVVRDAWVHVYSRDGTLDLGFGIYKGPTARTSELDGNLRFTSWEVTPAHLTRRQIDELVQSPEQRMSNELYTPIIVLEKGGKVLCGHQVLWRVTADEV